MSALPAFFKTTVSIYNSAEYNTQELKILQNTVMYAVLATTLHNSQHYNTV